MAPNPQCVALANAMKSKGVTYPQLSAQVGTPESVLVAICTGARSPTKTEFDSIARALDIKEQAPHNSAHKTA